jgi:hypothetical protein
MPGIQYSDLTLKQKEFFLEHIWNGVGSDSFIKPPPLIFLEASKYHDCLEWAGGTEEDREWAIKDFFHKAHEAVRAQSVWKRPYYYLLSYTYYYFLRKLDGFTWEYYPKPAQTWTGLVKHFKKRYLGLHNNVEPAWLRNSEHIN